MDRRKRARLAAEAAQGDTQAFSQLYGEIYKKLYYYALSNLRSPHDAADAVQDAVLDAYSGIGGLKNAEAFDKWMFTILSAKIRQKQKEYTEGRLSLQELDEGSPAVIAEEGGFVRCEILEELAGLSEAERLCITLHSIAGYRTREIAEMTGVSPSSVRSCISRGRSRLRGDKRPGRRNKEKKGKEVT